MEGASTKDEEWQTVPRQRPWGPPRQSPSLKPPPRSFNYKRSYQESRPNRGQRRDRLEGWTQQLCFYQCQETGHFARYCPWMYHRSRADKKGFHDSTRQTKLEVNHIQKRRVTPEYDSKYSDSEDSAGSRSLRWAIQRRLPSKPREDRNHDGEISSMRQDYPPLPRRARGLPSYADKVQGDQGAEPDEWDAGMGCTVWDPNFQEYECYGKANEGGRLRNAKVINCQYRGMLPVIFIKEGDGQPKYRIVHVN